MLLVFFQRYEERELGWMRNGYPIKILGGTEVEINKNQYN